MTHTLRFLLYNLSVNERHRQVFWRLYVKPDQLPRAPWQMSVLVAPPRMNCGSSQSSCGEEEIRRAVKSIKPRSLYLFSVYKCRHTYCTVCVRKLIYMNNNDLSELKHFCWVNSYLLRLSVAEESLWSMCVCMILKSVNSCSEGGVGSVKYEYILMLN